MPRRKEKRINRFSFNREGAGTQEWDFIRQSQIPTSLYDLAELPLTRHALPGAAIELAWYDKLLTTHQEIKNAQVTKISQGWRGIIRKMLN